MVVTSGKRKAVPLACSGQKLGMLVNILQDTEQSPQQRLNNLEKVGNANAEKSRPEVTR